MRFALLCDDLLAKPVVDALNDGVGGHQLTHAVRVTPQADQLLHGLHDVAFVEHWEDLLVDTHVDAILVGGIEPQILEGARQLATAGFPILFMPSASQGSTFAYEMSLIRDDNRVTLYPVFWHRFDAAAVRLKRAITEGTIGQVRFLQLKRSLGTSSPGMPIAQRDVDAELLLDIDLPRWLVGDYNQVTGLRTAATDVGVLMQSVVLAGRTLPELNWSIDSTEAAGEWRLIVRGTNGVAEMIRETSTQEWTCTIDGQCVQGHAPSTSRDLLAAFGTSISRKMPLRDEPGIVDGEWGDLVKCFETLEATHRSVTRRRTIELHFEPMSERAIFKTQMTAIGCGLLVATFFLSLCYLAIAKLIPLPSQVLIGLRALVFLPLVVFLVAQFLLPLTRPSTNEPIGRHN